jgi:hypothetical protein
MRNCRVTYSSEAAFSALADPTRRSLLDLLRPLLAMPRNRENQVSHRGTGATRHYFIAEKSVGCMYVDSTFSTSLLACSDFAIS